MSNNSSDVHVKQNATKDSYIIIPVPTITLVRNVCYFGVIPLMITIGLVLNSLCLKMFSTLKNKTSTVVLLLALTVTDMLCLLSGIVVVLVMASVVFGTPFDANQLRQSIPIFSAFLQSIPFRIESGLTFVISLERLHSVLQPMKVRQYWTKKNACIIVSIVYIFTIIVNLPNLFLYETDKKYSNLTGEYTIVLKLTSYGKNLKLNNGVFVAIEILFRYIPVFGVAISSGITAAMVIIAARRRLHMRKGNTKTQAFNKEKQVTRTLLIVTFVFFVCQLPSAVVLMIIIIDPEMTPAKYKNNIYELIVPMMFSFDIINSAVNFFIYITASSTYRDHFKRIATSVDIGRSKPIASNATTFTNPSFSAE